MPKQPQMIGAQKRVTYTNGFAKPQKKARHESDFWNYENRKTITDAANRIMEQGVRPRP